MINNQLVFKPLLSNVDVATILLPRCSSGFARSCRAPIGGAITFAIAEANAAVNVVATKQHSISCVSIASEAPEIDCAEDCEHLVYPRVQIRYWIFGRGVFIRELHPLSLYPGEQVALWAKLNSAIFFANTKHEHWAKFLSSNFVLYGMKIFLGWQAK